MCNKDELENLPAEAGEAIMENVNARIIIDEACAVVHSPPKCVDHLKGMRQKYVDKPQSE